MCSACNHECYILHAMPGCLDLVCTDCLSGMQSDAGDHQLSTMACAACKREVCVNDVYKLHRAVTPEFPDLYTDGATDVNPYRKAEIPVLVGKLSYNGSSDHLVQGHWARCYSAYQDRDMGGTFESRLDPIKVKPDSLKVSQQEYD